MALISNSTSDSLYEFCAHYAFWNQTTLNLKLPVFSPCFLDTVLVWGPAAFLWFLTPGFLLYIYKSAKCTPLPLSPINIAKGVVSFVIICLIVIQLILQEHDGYACEKNRPISEALYTAVAIKFCTMVLTVILQQIQRHKGVKTSGVPLCFWLILAGCEILPLYAHMSKKTICREDGIFVAYFCMITIQCLLHCFAEQHKRHGYYDLQKPCPDEDASVVSRVLFHWITPIVWTCWKKQFKPTSFWEQTSRLCSGHLGPLLEKSWGDEMKRCERARTKLKLESHDGFINGFTNGLGIRRRKQYAKNTQSEETPLLKSGKDSHEKVSDDPQPNLYIAVFWVFMPVWCEATAYMVFAESTWLLQPAVLRYIIKMIEFKAITTEPAWKGIFYAVLLFVVLCINSVMYHVAFHHMMTVGLKVKTALISLIYKKAFIMNRNGIKSTTVGEIVNLMSVDCQRIQDAFTFSHYLVIIFVMLILGGVQLWDLMGVASLGAISVMLIVLPVVGLIANKQFAIQKTLLDLKGNRIKTLNEVIGGIKVLKMYGWEPSFMEKIQAIRQNEIKCLRKYAVYAATTIVFAVHSPFMMNFVLVLIYVLTSTTHSLGAEETFTALSIVNILRYPIALCPFVVNGAVQAYVSIGRIQDYLATQNLNENNVKFVNEAEYPVSIQDGCFTWHLEAEKHTLNNINLQIKAGELVAVVGHVGSGKSSLISACLGEMEKVRGSVEIKGKLAYVPQEAWIQNMTLRENILFGKQYNETKYRKVIEACGLMPDLKILSGGDLTEIGEKGINISGGQKQRVSVARAVYNNADVYFLDDPLSAVDSHVGKHLFQKVIGNEGLLRNKTRILVTHGVHWLPMVDRIVVIDNNTISELGTYEELVNHNGPFAQFLRQYLLQNCEEDEDPEIGQIKDAIWSKIAEDIKSDGGITSDDEAFTSSGRKRYRSAKHKSFTSSKSIQNTKESLHSATKDFSRLTEEEVSEEGAIKATVLLTFVQAMGVCTVLIVFVTMAIFQGLNIFSNFWLTYWTEDELLKNISLSNTEAYEEKYMYYLLMYLMLGVLQGIVLFISFYMALTRMVQASGKLHDLMLRSILRSPMSFFDTTPIGRMMNRFSSDVDIMDNKLPDSFRLWSIMLFSTLAVLIVVGITTPIFIAAIIPIALFYVVFVKFYLPMARQMRRTESIRRSPIYNHFSETITGTSVIRAYQCADRFVQESRKRLDDNMKFYYASNTGSRWIGVRIELIGNVIALLATVFGLISDELNGAQVGLSITYAVQITITLNLVVLAVSEMEMNIVSAERVTEYTHLPSEAGWILEATKPPSGWPKTGKIEFHNYMSRYREGLDLVLRGISCTINDGEKVGIVGRTGAGKSSLALCLFRLIEPSAGSILIDGVNISKIGLHDLRTKLTILPQDPVLFSGSLRNNLDPFRSYNDDNIWQALECAHLKDFVTQLEEGIDYECGEGGQNLSIGQRQLVCLARTLLHKTRFLILDEATAAVDMETDDLIQETIRIQFKDCTILTIAHRLNTIMDYDRVMVLDAGQIKEFDSPNTLLMNTKSIFYGMAKDAGLV